VFPQAFISYQYSVLQLAIKLGGFAWLRALFRVLSGFCIKHRNLLEIRVEITAYNFHWADPFV
jgi:hypothetical protein